MLSNLCGFESFATVTPSPPAVNQRQPNLGECEGVPNFGQLDCEAEDQDAQNCHLKSETDSQLDGDAENIDWLRTLPAPPRCVLPATPVPTQLHAQPEEKSVMDGPSTPGRCVAPESAPSAAGSVAGDARQPAGFISKLSGILEDPALQHVIHWKGDDMIEIPDAASFIKLVLVQHFKHGYALD